jgi:hypothetical protein
LCVHIIRVVIDPDNDKPSNIKLVNIKKLEEVTMEAMSTFFADTKHASNSQKRPLLKEIFSVAKMEERFQSGGLGKVYVLE